MIIFSISSSVKFSFSYSATFFISAWEIFPFFINKKYCLIYVEVFEDSFNFSPSASITQFGSRKFQKLSKVKSLDSICFVVLQDSEDKLVMVSKT